MSLRKTIDRVVFIRQFDYNSNMRQRISPRRDKYDYTSPGWYFITICTKDREHYFGEIKNNTIILNDLGKYCNKEIERLSTRQTVDVHEYIVMPNHIHILLVVSEYPTVGADHQSALGDKSSISGDLLNRPYDGPSLSSIVKLFKGNITKYAQEHNIIFARQRSFHDHIIRNTQEYAP